MTELPRGIREAVVRAIYEADPITDEAGKTLPWETLEAEDMMALPKDIAQKRADAALFAISPFIEAIRTHAILRVEAAEFLCRQYMREAEEAKATQVHQVSRDG
jgi:hypothetical protein